MRRALFDQHPSSHSRNGAWLTQKPNPANKAIKDMKQQLADLQEVVASLMDTANGKKKKG
jgi:hypothetical protein